MTGRVDKKADAAVRVTLEKIVPAWLRDGGTLDELRTLIGEVEALADGKASTPSEAALSIYAVIRGRSKGTAKDVAEFIGLIAETLRQIDSAELVELGK